MQQTSVQPGTEGSRVAIVIGAGSGIGRTTTLRLAADGYRESDVDAVRSMVAATVQRFGRIDVVVNNAGDSRTGAFLGITVAEWREVMAADVESIVLGNSGRPAVPVGTWRGASSTSPLSLGWAATRAWPAAAPVTGSPV